MQLNGLRLDSKFSDSIPGSWAYAKNILISRGFDEIQNEKGDTVINNTITGDIFGRIVTPNEVILFIHDAPNVYIKSMATNGVVSPLLTTTDTYLDCTSSTIYVEGVHCYNNEGDLIIAWTTGVHKPMIMNVTHCLSTPVTISAESQLKDFYLFPEFNHNNFSLSSTGIITGGRLPAACYFVSLCYEVEPEINTNFSSLSNPIFITEYDSLTMYKQFKGNTSLIPTNKAFVITVNTPDTNYNYFKLAVIQKTETGTNCYITKRIKRSSTAVEVIIDDLDKLIPFNLLEVITSSPAFSKVKSITVSNKKLRLFNLEKPTKLTLAQIYDNIMPNLSVNWVNDTVVSLNTTKNSYKDSIFIFNKRGFRDDEVYALYLGLKLKTGGYYGIYHIPGRTAIGSELTDVTTVDGVSISNYRLSSTATSDGSYYGKMGYWQNEDETYPSGYGTISGQKVRHHRFPSAGQLHSWKTGLVHTTAKATMIDTVNFTIDDFLKTGNIYYGAMTPSTLPIGGTFLPASLTGNNYNKYTALFNQVLSLDFSVSCMVATYSGTLGSARLLIKKYALQKDGSFIESTVRTETKNATGSPETLSFTYTGDVSLNIGDYITFEIYALTEHEYEGFTPSIENGGTTTHFHTYESTTTHEILGLRIALDWNSVDAAIRNSLSQYVDSWEILYAKRTLQNQIMIDQSLAVADGAGYRFYGFDSMSNLLNLEPTHVKAQLKVDTADYINGAYINEVTNYTSQTAEYSAVTKIKYLPAYNSATVPSNKDRENCYYFETTSGTFDLRLVNLINIKNNTYKDFTSQELVNTGITKALTQTAAFSLYGGDTYIGHNSVLTFPEASSVPRIWYFPVASILNSGMRYEGENDYEKFYPATNITESSGAAQPYIVAMIAAGVANNYIYNNAYHILNTIRQDNIDNELTSIVTKFPNRIQSSLSQPLESSSMYWRKYKILDYFDMPNSKGAIYKAVGNDRIVYIKTDYSLYRGIIVDKLITGQIDVALKSSEMFDRDLEELFDADGEYIKCWNREGMIFTPYGLVIADIDKGSIFVINEQSNEISKLGIEDWFRNTIKNIMTFGTKETIGAGVSLGYDDIYKRLLVTIKNDNPATIANFTLSFQLEKMYWISFHTYTPDKYFWNANALYCLRGNDVFKLNSGNYGYYNASYTDSIIDFIFNNTKVERFLLKNVRWVTNIEVNNINYWDETITKLMVYSKNLCTNEITIVKRSYSYNGSGVLQETGNTMYRDGEWIYDDVKDYLSTPNSAFLDNNFTLISAALNLSKNYYDMSKFITKFVIVRMIYTNTSANKQIKISNVNIDIKNIL